MGKIIWGLCFAEFWFFDVSRAPLASHDSNPYPNRSRITRYNATMVLSRTAHYTQRVSGRSCVKSALHSLYILSDIATSIIGDRKGTAKKLCDKDFAECSSELSGGICLKTFAMCI